MQTATPDGLEKKGEGTGDATAEDGAGEIGSAGCAFLLGNGESGPGGSRFCDAPRQPGSAYCPLHHALCHLPIGSTAERRRLREIEALAEAVGGKQGGHATQPSPGLLRRLDRIARASSRPYRSCIVLNMRGISEAGNGDASTS